MSPHERALDPAARLQHALDLAYRQLARRDRTAHELRRCLEAKRVDPATIEHALASLHEHGYLDDERYAERFAEDKRELAHWGPERIRQRLVALGISPEIADAASQRRSAEDELEAALGILRRRFHGPFMDLRDRNRAHGMLVRRGYDPDFAGDAIRAYDRRERAA